MAVIPPLLLLPTMVLDPDGLDELAALCGDLAPRWLVLVGHAVDDEQRPIDEFALAVALVAAHGELRVGVATQVGAGRVPSIIAREATSAELLGACDAVFLEGPIEECADAARVIEALFAPGTHSLTTPTASIAEAVNDPQPSRPGGPPVRFATGGALRGLRDGRFCDLGAIHVAQLPGALPDARDGDLVVLRHPAGRPAALGAAMHP